MRLGVVCFLLLWAVGAVAQPAPRPRVVRSMRVEMYDNGTARIDIHSRPSQGQSPVRYRDDMIPAADVPTVTSEFITDSPALKDRKSNEHRQANRPVRTPKQK
jgi:hypothetical protein